jgi:hypothetical protein
MLDNTLNLKASISSLILNTPVSLIDVDNGSSVRKYTVSATESYTLKISNQSTKENPPVGTNRTQLRLEHTKVLTDGSERTSFVSLVLASPRDTNFSTNDMIGLVHAIATLISPSHQEGLEANEYTVGQPAHTFVTRLLTGEV